MKKILMSLLAIFMVAGGTWYATNAFFSDTETSTGNVLGAGSIDLKVGSNGYYNGEENTGTTWGLGNISETEFFFNFTDLKPGDEGENTIDLKVEDNDAWACAKITLTQNDENTAIDPEKDAGDDPDSGEDLFDGELAQNLHFVWWPDDGNNVLEESEAAKIHLNDKLLTLMTFDDTDDKELDLTLADSVWNFFEDAPGPVPLTGNTEYHIGVAWCFGELTVSALPDGTGTDPTVNSGILCDGQNVDNTSQTDLVEGTLEFTAVQYRNNEQFLCPEHEI